MEVVGRIGVDLNTCLKHPHLSSPLQFIAGLGPRKARHLISALAKKHVEIIMKRDQLNKFIGPIVY